MSHSVHYKCGRCGSSLTVFSDYMLCPVCDMRQKGGRYTDYWTRFDEASALYELNTVFRDRYPEYK